MAFEDLKLRIKQFFQEQEVQGFPSVEIKKALDTEVMEMFNLEQENFAKNNPRLKKVFYFLATFTGALFLFYWLVFTASAPTIIASQGLVEVTHKHKVEIIDSEIVLHKGDFISLGSSAEAVISFDDKVRLLVSRNARVRIIDKNKIFLSRGNLQIQTTDNSWFQNDKTKLLEIKTERGTIYPYANLEAEIDVSETGETHIISRKNKVLVTDFLSGEKVLQSNEEVRLRTDTMLANVRVPEGLKLSDLQIQAIESKLDIVRTKLVHGLVNLSQKQDSEAEEDFDSAIQSFRSILNVLDSSRHLEIVSRKSLNKIRNREVLAKLSQKTDKQNLIDQGKSILTFFDILDEQRENLKLRIRKNNNIFFYRFALLKQFFSYGTPEQKLQGDILANEYIQAQKHKIMSEDNDFSRQKLFAEDFSQINNSIFACEFLKELNILLPSDMSKKLEKKVEKCN